MPQSLVSRIGVWSLALSSCIANSQTLAKLGKPNVTATRNVIVIMKDQVSDLQPVRGARQSRASALAATQSPLIADLLQSRARQVKSFRMINAFATSVTAAEAEKLESNPQVKAVVSDAIIRLPRQNHDRADSSAAGHAGSSVTPRTTTGTQAPQCNTLEPEALQVTNTAYLNLTHPQAQLVTDGHGRRVTGQGVKVAYIADGLDPTIPGFIRPDGSAVFVDYQNFTGDPDGTPTGGGEAFLDASSIAAQDMPNGAPLYYDISPFSISAYALPSPCKIRVRGIAPGASLVGLNVFSSLGYTTTSNFVQAIEYAVFDDDVDVLNESFGGNPLYDNGNDPISLANATAVRAGVTVVSSTGDAGTAGTIGSPATNKDSIAAGATTTFRIYSQITDGIIPFADGYVSGNISSLSSGGFAQRTPRTVDLVAPGDSGWALCSPNATLFTECGGAPVEATGGTSESSPLIAAAAALVIQAYRSTHNDVSPSPALVKRILMSTATDIFAPSDEEGAGLINTLSAVHMALSLNDQNGAPANRGDGLFLEKTSAEFVDKPNSPQDLTFTVRNTGTGTRHIAPHLQTLSTPNASAKVTLTLSPTTDPTFVDGGGTTRSYLKQTFVVPPGNQHLDAAIAFTPFTSLKLVRLGLLDPSGRQAAFSIPQGEGNGYAHVDVVRPAPGTWTAIIYTRSSGASSYAGPVHFSWSAEHYVSFGTVSPTSLDLAPGELRTVTARFDTPSHPGDTAASIRFIPLSGEEGKDEPEIPVTIRTLVPVGENGGSFTGTLTGGNGRAGTGPVQTFEFNVPERAKGLSLGLNVRDSSYALEGLLVDPNGMQLSVGVNSDPVTGAPQKALQLYHEHPQAGRWHFVLLQNFTSSGNQTSLPFSAHIGLDTVPYDATDVPNNPATKLSAAAGPVTVPVTVTNNSAIKQTFFADARLKDRAITDLPLFLCSETTTLPGVCLYTYVPPETNDVQFEAQSNVPITMDAFNEAGTGVGETLSPDLFGRNIGPDTSIASLHTSEVPWSFWVESASLVGPYGSGGAPTAPLNADVLVNMRPFDPAVSADSGNQFLDFTFGTTTYNPLVLAPGATGKINLTITPDASQIGQTIKGFIYLDNFNNSIGTGDEIARIPYTYTVAP